MIVKRLVSWASVAVTMAGGAPFVFAATISPGYYDLGAGQTAVDVSRDGTLVGVENSTTATGYMWTQANGLVSVGASRLRGVDWYNDDGFYSGSTSNTVIVAGRDGANLGARVWFGNADGSGTATWYDLPVADGVAGKVWLANENALGVKADGTDWYVAGFQSGVSPRTAVRYRRSSNSATSISAPVGGAGGTTNNAQFDGASDTGVFTGRHNNSSGARKPRYQSIFLPSIGSEGETNDISGNGLISVGWDDGTKPTFWTTSGAGARFAIPLLAGDTVGEATGVNEDGSIIVGWSRVSTGVGLKNWIWDATNGTRELKTAIEAMGIDLPDEWTFVGQANQSVSLSRTSGGAATGYNGLTIVGQVEIAGGSPHAYAVNILPEPATLGLLALGGGLCLRRRRSL